MFVMAIDLEPEPAVLARLVPGQPAMVVLAESPNDNIQEKSRRSRSEK